MEQVEAREHAVTRSRKRRGSKNWRNIKVKEHVYEYAGKLAEMLGVKKYKLIEISLVILSPLIREKVVISQEMLTEELIECKVKYGYDEETGFAWAELDPKCVLKKVILPFYRKHKLLENLVQNIEDLVQS